MDDRPFGRGVLLWSVILGLQVIAAELNFALVVEEGSRADDARRVLQAGLFVVPAAVITVRSSSVSRRLGEPPMRDGLLWLGWACLSVLWSVAPGDTLVLAASLTGLWLTATGYVLVFGFEPFAKTVVSALSAFMMVGLLYEVSGATEPGLLRRFSGISVHSTNLGRIAMITALLAIVLGLEYGWRRWPFVFCLGVSTLAMLSTGTRTAIGVYAVAVVLFVHRWLGAARAVAFAAVCGAAAAVANLFLDDTVETLSRAKGPDEITSFHGRTDIWEASWAAIVERPILGHGLGASAVVLEAATSQGELVIQVGHAHQLVLGQLLMVGAIGLGLFAWMLIAYGRAGSSATSQLAPVVLIAVVLSGITESILNRPTAAMAILAALLAERVGRPNRNRTPAPASFARAR